VLRIVRILRVLRLFKQAQQVRILVETLWFSLPSIANISLFMMLIYFVFAIVGVQLFANVPAGRFLTDDFFNFRSFPAALQMMFIYTTNERWSDAMYDTMDVAPDCDVACGSPAAGVLFHITFVLISAFVISNLFIAIILDNFATTMRLEASQVSMGVLHRYTEIWGMLDREGTMLLPTQSLPFLLSKLQPPLGVARRDSRLELLERMSQYQIPDHAGQIHFVEVLIPLASVAAGVELDEREARRQQEHVRRTFPDILSLPTFRFDHQPVHVGHFLAQTYVASAYRGRSIRRTVRGEYLRRLRQLEQYVRDNPNAASGVVSRLSIMRRRVALQDMVSSDLHVEDL